MLDGLSLSNLFPGCPALGPSPILLRWFDRSLALARPNRIVAALGLFLGLVSQGLWLARGSLRASCSDGGAEGRLDCGAQWRSLSSSRCCPVS